MMQRLFRVWVQVALLVASGLFTPPAHGQWNTNAWARDPSFRNTNAMWATIHDFTVTNEVSPTNFVVTNIYFRSHITFTNYTTNAIAGSWTQRSLRWTNGVPTNFSYTISDSKVLVQTNLVQTWQDQIQLDCALAIDERMRSLPYYQPSFVVAHRSMRLYPDRKATLEYFKTQLDWVFGDGQDFDDFAGFVAAPAFSNKLATSTLTATDAEAVIWHNSTPAASTTNDIRFAASLPSNYFAVTFARDLFHTNSYYRNTMTCTVTFASSLTNRTTNIVTDCCGNTNVTVSGTNSEVVLIVCTNASILPGYTAADYNYYGLRRALTNMTGLIHVPRDGGGSLPWITFGASFTQYYRTGSGTSAVDVATAKSDALAALAAASVLTNAFVEQSHDYTWAQTGANNEAVARKSTSEFRFGVWSNDFPHDLVWYAGAPAADVSFFHSVDTAEFSDMQTGLSNGNYLVQYQSQMVSNIVSTGLLFTVASEVVLTNWAAGTGGGNPKGYDLRYPLWVSWPKPTTNGFRYR